MEGYNISSTMKALPETERPYEKCFEHGPAYLTDAELLAVVLRSGTPGESALELSRRLFRDHLTEGLPGLYHLSLEELMQIRGIGKVKAILLKCIGELSVRMASSQAMYNYRFDSPESVAECYMEYLRHEEQETVRLLSLDMKGNLLDDSVITRGTVSASLVSPREIFMTALRKRAVSVILLHNHPSGDPSPSREDIQITNLVRESGELLGIELLDHIIIGDLKAFSFRKEGLLNSSLIHSGA